MDSAPLFDVRGEQEAHAVFDYGIANQKIAIAAIKKYNDTWPWKMNFFLKDYTEIPDDAFYTDGRPHKKYDVDYILDVVLRNGAEWRFNAEVKTTEHILREQTFCKASQVDKLINKYGNMAVIIVSDPVKFTFKNAVEFKKISWREPRREYGGKEAYVTYSRNLHWVEYGFETNFVHKASPCKTKTRGYN